MHKLASRKSRRGRLTQAAISDQGSDRRSRCFSPINNSTLPSLNTSDEKVARNKSTRRCARRNRVKSMDKRTPICVNWSAEDVNLITKLKFKVQEARASKFSGLQSPRILFAKALEGSIHQRRQMSPSGIFHNVTIRNVGDSSQSPVADQLICNFLNQTIPERVRELDL